MMTMIIICILGNDGILHRGPTRLAVARVLRPGQRLSALDSAKKNVARGGGTLDLLAELVKTICKCESQHEEQCLPNWK